MMSSVGIVTGAGRGMGLECAKRLTMQVDQLILVDLDEDSVAQAADVLSGERAVVEPFRLDVTDVVGLAGLAARVGELGTLRAVAHAAGISPTMADWRRIFEVDLIGTARLAEALRPLATSETATVCFSSLSPLLQYVSPGDEAIGVALADPLHPEFFERILAAAGSDVEDPGRAYPLAKRGVAQFVRQEAVRLGAVGARICSVAPGLIDTPQGRQEAEKHPIVGEMVAKTPLGRMGFASEVASVVAFILSDGGSFLNGIDLLVDGGVFAALTVEQQKW